MDFQSFSNLFNEFSTDFPIQTRPFRCDFPSDATRRYGRRRGAELSGGAGQNNLGAGHADAVALGR